MTLDNRGKGGHPVLGEVPVGTTPFDTLATIYEMQARSGSGGAPALAVAAWMAVIHEDLDRAAALAAEANALAVGPQASLVAGLVDVVDVFRGGTSGADGALDRVRDVLLVADAEDPVLTALEVMLEVANWFTFWDRHADAAQLLDRRLVWLRSAGRSDLALAWTLTSLAELDLRRGRWQRCIRHLGEVIDLSQRVGDGVGYTRVLAARAAAAQGRFDVVSEHLRLGRSDAHELGDRSTLWRADAAEGFAALSAGDPARAALVLGSLLERLDSHAPLTASIRLWDADLVQALVCEDRIDEARSVAARLAEHPQPRTGWSAGTALRCAALVAADPGTGAKTALASAAAFERIGAPFEQARSLLVAAESLGRCGAAAQADLHRQRAAATFVALGADAWRDLACPLRSVSTPARPQWSHALTNQEYAVAAALARGGSNQQIADELFVSVKTIEVHLTRIYRKLHVRSRTQLLAAISQR